MPDVDEKAVFYADSERPSVLVTSSSIYADAVSESRTASDSTIHDRLKCHVTMGRT